MSIFKDQLNFEQLTPERRIIFKMELAGGALSICLVYLAVWMQLCRNQFQDLLEAWLLPIAEPVRAFVRGHILAPLAAIGNFIHFALPPNIADAIQSFFHYTHSVLSALTLPLLALGFLSCAIAIHSGIIGPPRHHRKRFQGVIEHEWHKLMVRLFEARINMHVGLNSVFRTVLSTVVMFAVSYVVLFSYFSGFLAQHVPIVFPYIEPGMHNWFLASLRDAHISFPANWTDYSDEYLRVLKSHADPKTTMFYRAFMPVLDAPVMPPELARLRMFVAALCSFLGAFPFTLSMIAVGLDSFSGRRVSLTPTRIIDTTTTFYIVPRSRTFKWNDLFRASLCEASSTLTLEFSENRKLVLPLRKLSQKDRLTLVQALEELAPVCEFNAQLKHLMSKTRVENAAGYTVFWDDELAQKRRSTVFVPLGEGTKLKDGNLEILRQLSGQGWSATYLARLNGEFVIVRESILSRDTDTGMRAWSTLENEATILGQLDHPGIAKVLDHFVENEKSYLLLEYVMGSDLRKKTNLNSRLPEKTVLEIAERLCDILEYLHDGNPPVIHRDISPDNLVITPNNEIRLIDFAASKQFVETATGTMIGKRSYMAPEQLRGRAGTRSDIYSLGATMYFLLTGEDPLALSQCTASEHLPGVNAELDALIQEMTSFDEKDRPTSARLVKQRLAAIKEDRGSVLELIRDGLSPDFARIKIKQYEAERL